MKSTQDTLELYQKQKQAIINNKHNYTFVRYYSEYGNWQNGSYAFNGQWIYDNQDWMYSRHWKAKRFGMYIRENDVDVRASIRQVIAQKSGRPLDDIHPWPDISEAWIYGDNHCANGCKEYVFDTYVFKYKHRKLEPRSENFFDQAKYNQALNECEQKITMTELRLKNALETGKIPGLNAEIAELIPQNNELQDKLNELYRQNTDQYFLLNQYHSRKDILTNNIHQKQQNIASKQHEYDQLSNTKQDLHGYLASLANNHYQKQQEVKANIVQNQNLKSEIVQKTNTIDDLNKKFDESQKNVQALNQKINEINYKCTQTIYQTKSTQEEVKILNAKISQIKGEYVDKIKSVTNQERALLFSESVDKPDQIHKTAIDIIKLTGFDPNYLAYIAIDKNRADLFELSIKSGANFRNCFINGKTLFQHAVNNDNFASKIVLAEQNLDVTLIQSMRSKDYLTIDKLLQLKPDVVTKTVNGYSPLQVAVIYEDYKLTQKFIEKNIASISTLSSENESVFKVALRSSNEEIVNLLLTKVDLVKEISELVRTNEIELVKKVLDLHEFPHNTIQQLLSTASNSSFNELEKIFIEKGGKLEEVQRIAHQEQQEPLIQLKDNFYLAMLNFNVNKFFTDQIQDNIYILGDQFTNIIENIYEIN